MAGDDPPARWPEGGVKTMAGWLEKLRVWQRVYRRIRFFDRMYPLSVVLKDVVLFPLDYHLKRRPIRAVRNVTVAITHQCNIRCTMCYFHEELSNRKVLPLEVFQRFIDQVAVSRPCVILSGGEPFTHPRLLDMVAHAKGKGLPVQIFTNGVMVRPEKADRLAELGLDYIDFTLLGNSVTHDRVAQSPGAYGRLLENLAYFAAHRRETRLILNFTITPDAIDDLEHAVELTRRFQLDGLRIQHYNFLRPGEHESQARVMEAVFGASAGTNEIVDDHLRIAGMAAKIAAFQARLPELLPDIPVQWAPDLTDEELEHWYADTPFKSARACLFCWRGMLLDADGVLYPCSKIYLPLGSVAGEDPLTVWNNPRMERFREHLQAGGYPACSRCCKL